MSLLLLYRSVSGPAPPAPPPVLAPTLGTARAQYIVEVAWTDYAAGLLTFDFSTFDGSDLFAASSFEETFGGEFDNISEDVTGVTYTRGRSSDLTQSEEGRCTIRLLDTSGKYNRQNPASPIVDSLIPLRAVRVRAVQEGVTTGLYSGWIRRITYEPNGRRGSAQIECSDLLMRLKRDKPQIPASGQTTTGVVIGSLLDSVGYTTPTLRSVDQGDIIPEFTGDGVKDSIAHLSALLEAEGGFFFHAGSGVATYHDRHHRDTAAVSGTIENQMKALSSGTDLDAIVNKWTITRQTIVDGQTVDGTPQVATDDASVARYGEIPNEFTTLYLIDDVAAAGAAEHRLSKTADPAPPLWSLKIDNRTPALLYEILHRDVDDLVLVSELQGLTYGRFFIERLSGEIDVLAGRHTIDYTLTEGSLVTPIEFDVSLFEGSHAFVY